MTRDPARPLRVCVDARLRHGASGGVEQVVLGLATGLSALRDGDEEYLFLTLPGEEGWIAPAVTGPCSLLAAAVRPPAPPRDRGLRSRVAARLPWAASAYGCAHDAVVAPRIEPGDGRVEAAGADVMHFTFQDGFRTRIPSVFQPHDLQHVHLPQFFTWRQRRWRSATYRALARQAAAVAVASSWVMRDVVAHLGVPEQKVHVVPLAPIVAHYPDADREAAARTRERLGLPERFALYPAQTWPHKNHIGLLEAMALLRAEHGVDVPLACCGHMTDFAEDIRRRAAELGVAHLLHLVGFVSPTDLQALYRAARCVVVPTLFEAASFPLWEAFRNEVPAACSNVTSLPEQAGDAALVFDPRDRRSIAGAVLGVWKDEDLRRSLVAKGRSRVARLSWERTARTFRALYRRVGGRIERDEDRELLRAPPLL